MPKKLLYDLDSLDLGRTQFSLEDVEATNPQRHEFAQLGSVTHLDDEEEIIVSVRELREDEFWTRGHMPGRPIFPGVLMLEMLFQSAAIWFAGRAEADDEHVDGWDVMEDPRWEDVREHWEVEAEDPALDGAVLGDLEEVYNAIENLERTERTEESYAEHYDLYPKFVAGALALYLLAWLSLGTWARRLP